MTTIVRTVKPPRRPNPTQASPHRHRRAQPAEVAQHEIILHGQPVNYLETGADTGGPVVVLLHGMASSSQTWATVMPLLGTHAHVIAPDLLGHGLSAKPRSGDYSLGAYAAGLRDLLVALDPRRRSTGSPTPSTPSPTTAHAKPSPTPSAAP